MVEHQTLPLDTIFHALSDGTRRSMLAELAKSQRTVSELAEPFSMSLAAASKHIKVLESAGLLRREIQGRIHLCRLEPTALATAHQWLSFYEGFWTDRLNILDQLLRADGTRAPTPPPPSKGEKP